MTDAILDRARELLRLDRAYPIHSSLLVAVCKALLAADERARALAEAARADERDQCAATCDALAAEWQPSAEAEYSRDDYCARCCAAAIRARGQAKADAAGSGE